MKYISGDELAEIIKSDKVAHQDYLVVDVRDDDYAGGNIKSLPFFCTQRAGGCGQAQCFLSPRPR
ncbi:hypothetical protein DFH06DRAFT_1229136 [Mycena polygramma]|nr:hypothetical protein DFH06DRAFT_1229136 [Mycena polygramma]